MSPVKRLRRLPTLVNRGLGLLEVILPRGTAGDTESCLPPGRRDSSGFWFPARYERPGDIFTRQQRELQAIQRSIQRRRLRRDGPAAVPVATGDVAVVPFGNVGADSAAHRAGTPSASSRIAVPPAEFAVPLPSPMPEALPPPVPKAGPRPPGAASSRSSPAGPPILPNAE